MLKRKCADPLNLSIAYQGLQSSFTSLLRYNDVCLGWDPIAFITGDGLIAVKIQAIFHVSPHVQYRDWT